MVRKSFVPTTCLPFDKRRKHQSKYHFDSLLIEVQISRSNQKENLVSVSFSGPRDPRDPRVPRVRTDPSDPRDNLGYNPEVKTIESEGCSKLKSDFRHCPKVLFLFTSKL